MKLLNMKGGSLSAVKDVLVEYLENLGADATKEQERGTDAGAPSLSAQAQDGSTNGPGGSSPRELRASLSESS